MDEAIYQENKDTMRICGDADQLLRDLRRNAATAQDPNSAQLLHQAHDALNDIWYKALPGPIGPNCVWDESRMSVNNTIALFDTMAQQLDTGKFDFQMFQSSENRHNLLLAIKTLEVCMLNLKAYDEDEYYHFDRQALDQLELMLHTALGLIQTLYDLLKEAPKPAPELIASN